MRIAEHFKFAKWALRAGLLPWLQRALTERPSLAGADAHMFGNTAAGSVNSAGKSVDKGAKSFDLRSKSNDMSARSFNSRGKSNDMTGKSFNSRGKSNDMKGKSFNSRGKSNNTIKELLNLHRKSNGMAPVSFNMVGKPRYSQREPFHKRTVPTVRTGAWRRLLACLLAPPTPCIKLVECHHRSRGAGEKQESTSIMGSEFDELFEVTWVNVDGRYDDSFHSYFLPNRVHDLLWFLVIDKWIGRNMKFLLAYALAHIRLVLGTTWRAACGLRWQAIALAQAFDRGPLGSRPPPPIFA